MTDVTEEFKEWVSSLYMFSECIEEIADANLTPSQVDYIIEYMKSIDDVHIGVCIGLVETTPLTINQFHTIYNAFPTTILGCRNMTAERLHHVLFETGQVGQYRLAKIFAHPQCTEAMKVKYHLQRGS